ncbi:hypothetical protein M9458_053865 [Cirrhinus mrigala]|uniref:Uncharacterized protein n=1 Tax=Cirrhinus mrigala TaxID=683832 RepID=A0ABD0MLS2_CIRMR
MGGAASRCRPRPYERTGVVHSHPTLSPSVWMLLWLLWIPGHPHTDLYQRLLIIDRFRALGVRHRDVVLAHMKVLGLRLNAKKSVLSPLQRTTYLGVVWDLTTMQARLSPARIESILTAVVRVREGRSLAVKQFQQLLGLIAAVSNVIPFGLLYMRPLQLHSSSSTGAGCHSTDVAEASSIRLSLIALLPGVLKLYALKWKPFTSWCEDRQQDSVNCPVGTVLGFLQDRFSTGLAQSTLKVYVAAISAYHAPLGGSSVGRNPLVTRFLRGELRPRPLARCSFAKCVGFRMLRNVHPFDFKVLSWTCATSGSFSLALAVLFHTRQGFEVWWHGHLVPIAFFDAARVTYVTMVPRGNETLPLGPYFQHPCSACFSIKKLPAACTAHAFKLTGLYVTPPVTSRFSIGLYAHVFQSVVTLEAVSFPRGTMVTYVT